MYINKNRTRDERKDNVHCNSAFKLTFMAGIYIHIPFCKTRCTYCDFFTKTNFSLQENLLNAMCREIEQRKDYLREPVETIYFGGGTPSVLPITDVKTILNTCFFSFTVNPDAEITLEANPDDLSHDYLEQLREAGINRLSMGVQSFDDEQLKAVKRRHSATEAVQSIEWAHKAGFENISIDLIFGLPGQSLQSWKAQVDKAVSLDVQHLSAYGLTYETGTPLWYQMKAGTIVPTDEETMIEMYEYLIKTCESNLFEQYEISNFARNGLHSRHNSSYWKQIPYVGIGPAAHSFDGDSRQWNVSSIEKYIRHFHDGTPCFEKELLTVQDKYNDFVMVSLRTMKGINLPLLENLYGKEYLNHFVKSSKKFLENNKLRINDDYLRLTPDGVMISDSIIMELFVS
ncbi:MAG: radical SAM family heme chaperone HemW [Paludibacteraceae bacterium]